MSEIVTAAQVEAAFSEGRRQLLIADGTIVTPFARDRADALGVTLAGVGSRGAAEGSSGSEGSAPRQGRRGGRREVERLALESEVRIIARRALLRQDRGLGQLDDLVAAVMARLEPNGQSGAACGCDGATSR